MDNSLEVVNVEQNEKGWSIFDPETGLAVGGPFGSEGEANDHALEQGWVVAE